MEIIYQFFAHGVEVGIIPRIFEHPFMVRGLISALIIAPLLGGMGTLIISNRLVFFSQTISHASLTGVALGLFFGEPVDETYAGLYGFTLLTAMLMLYVRRQTRSSPDTITGVILAQILGLGVVALVMVTKQFNVHQVEAILFGSLITINDQDIGLLLLTVLFVAVVIFLFYNQVLLIGFNPLLAKAQGMNTLLVEYLFVLVISLVIVASLKIIGALLVLALIVVPSATAQNLSKTLSGFFWFSVLFATVSAVGGLFILAIWSLPTGGAIVLIASILFYLSLLIKPWFGYSAIQQGNE